MSYSRFEEYENFEDFYNNNGSVTLYDYNEYLSYKGYPPKDSIAFENAVREFDPTFSHIASTPSNRLKKPIIMSENNITIDYYQGLVSYSKSLSSQVKYYYIVKFYKEVLKDIQDSNQGVVAKKLNISMSSMSIIYRLLTAIESGALE